MVSPTELREYLLAAREGGATSVRVVGASGETIEFALHPALVGSLRDPGAGDEEADEPTDEEMLLASARPR